MSSVRRTGFALSAAFAVTIGCAAAQSRSEPTSGPLVTSDDLAKGDPIEVIIQRKVPGVVVTSTSDGGIALQIRGATTYNNTQASPLYVVNGLPLQPGPGGSLDGINPRDIQSIRVLKGAETSMYGIDGANGVIVVTTKSAGTLRP